MPFSSNHVPLMLTFIFFISHNELTISDTVSENIVSAIKIFLWTIATFYISHIHKQLMDIKRQTSALTNFSS